MQGQRGKLRCAGYSLGHPAAGGGAAWFADLEAACGALADRGAGDGLEVHAIWLAEKRAAALLRETADPRQCELLRAPAAPEPPPALAAGWDVLGFGDALYLSWADEPAGRELAERLQLAARPDTFLPGLRVATELAKELEDDVLSAPVLWLPCWRTVHAPQGSRLH